MISKSKLKKGRKFFAKMLKVLFELQISKRFIETLLFLVENKARSKIWTILYFSNRVATFIFEDTSFISVKQLNKNEMYSYCVYFEAFFTSLS